MIASSIKEAESFLENEIKLLKRVKKAVFTYPEVTKEWALFESALNIDPDMPIGDFLWKITLFLKNLGDEYLISLESAVKRKEKELGK